MFYLAPCCHGIEIWHKINYNSACIRDIAKILAPVRKFWGSGYRITSGKFNHDRPLLP